MSRGNKTGEERESAFLLVGSAHRLNALLADVAPVLYYDLFPPRRSYNTVLSLTLHMAVRSGGTAHHGNTLSFFSPKAFDGSGNIDDAGLARSSDTTGMATFSFLLGSLRLIPSCKDENRFQAKSRRRFRLLLYDIFHTELYNRGRTPLEVCDSFPAFILALFMKEDLCNHSKLSHSKLNHSKLEFF